MGVVDSYQDVSGGTGVGIISFFLLFVLLSFVHSCPASFLIEYSKIAFVSVSLFIICFLCLWSI